MSKPVAIGLYMLTMLVAVGLLGQRVRAHQRAGRLGRALVWTLFALLLLVWHWSWPVLLLGGE